MEVKFVASTICRLNHGPKAAIGGGLGGRSPPQLVAGVWGRQAPKRHRTRNEPSVPLFFEELGLFTITPGSSKAT